MPILIRAEFLAGFRQLAGVHNITIYVSDPYGHSASTTAQITVSPRQATSVSYVFTRYLGYGDTGDDVSTLQKYLLQQGFFSATPNGRYGPATKSAVQKFQQAHGIKQTGNVGPSTKDALNQIAIPNSPSTNTTKEQQILQIQQEIQQLQVQLSSLQ